jgi:hypothetical protein
VHPVAPRRPRRLLRVALPAGAAVLALAAIPVAASAAFGSTAAAAHPAAARVAAVVPSTTKGLPATDIAAVATSGSHVTIKLSKAQPIRAGYYVVAGIGKATPQGLIAKVTKASGLTLSATKATLKQAIPQGSFSGYKTYKSIKATIQKSVVCGAGGGTVPVQGVATITVSPKISASWTAKSAVVTVTAAVSGTAQVASIRVSPYYSCKVSTVAVTGTGKLAPFQVSVGGLPVVITPTLRWFADSGVDTSSQFPSTDVGQNFSITATLTDAAGKYATHGAAKVSAKNYLAPNIAPSNNTIIAGIEPSVGIGLFGHGAANVTLGLGAKFTMSPNASPWWAADATQTASGNATMPDLGLKSATKALLNHVTVAAHAPTPKAGMSVYGTYGTQQGVTRGPDGRIWMISYFPTAQQGTEAGSLALAATSPRTLVTAYYGPLPPYIGFNNKSTKYTVLNYTSGAPAFDGAQNAWLIATGINNQTGSVSAHYLVRFTPGSGKSAIVKVPSSCGVPEGLTSAGDGAVWLRCGTSGLATPKVLRITDSGKMTELSVDVTAVGAFAAGGSGSVWAVGYNSKGQSVGLVQFGNTGGERVIGNSGALRVAGNGTGRVIAIDRCGSVLCYVSVATSGRLTRVANEPGSAASVSGTFGPAMDPSGNVWTMQTGSVSKTHEYFLLLSAKNKVKAYSFAVPGGCGGSLLSLAGSMAATSDGSAWGESQSNCIPIGITGTAYVGGLIRFLA